MFANQESFPVIQSMKLKNKDSTNLMKFLNEQKYRYITKKNEYTNEMINSLFSLLNHVVSLAIQFSHPVSKAQLTNSKVIQIKSGLEKEIESFIELNSNNNNNRDNHKHSNQINTNTSQKSSFDFKQSSTSRNKITNPITPHKTEQCHYIKEKLLSTSYKDNNKKFIFVYSMSKSNKKKEISKSVEKTPHRNQSEYLFHNIPKIEDQKHNAYTNTFINKQKKGLTEIKPSYNATKLVVQYKNVIDKYYSIKTEEQDKKNERSHSKEKVCSTFHC